MGVEHCATLVGKFPHAKLVAVGKPPALLLVDGKMTGPKSVPGELIFLLIVVEEVETVDEGRGAYHKVPI